MRLPLHGCCRKTLSLSPGNPRNEPVSHHHPPLISTASPYAGPMMTGIVVSLFSSATDHTKYCPYLRTSDDCEMNTPLTTRRAIQRRQIGPDTAHRLRGIESSRCRVPCCSSVRVIEPSPSRLCSPHPYVDGFDDTIAACLVGHAVRRSKPTADGCGDPLFRHSLPRHRNLRRAVAGLLPGDIDRKKHTCDQYRSKCCSSHHLSPIRTLQHRGNSVFGFIPRPGFRARVTSVW